MPPKTGANLKRKKALDIMKAEEDDPGSTDSSDKKQAKKAKTNRKSSDETYNDSDDSDDHPPRSTPRGRKKSASSLVSHCRRNALKALADISGKPNVARCAVTELNNISHVIEMSHVIRGGLPGDTVSKTTSAAPNISINIKCSFVN